MPSRSFLDLRDEDGEYEFPNQLSIDHRVSNTGFLLTDPGKICVRKLCCREGSYLAIYCKWLGNFRASTLGKLNKGMKQKTIPKRAERNGRRPNGGRKMGLAVNLQFQTRVEGTSMVGSTCTGSRSASST